MKTHLFSDRCFVKTALLTTLMFLINSLSFAQNNTDVITYASSQTNSVSALCLLCSVQNPQNAVGNDQYDYSSLKIGIGVLGKVEQTLQFPTVSTQKLTIKIGTNSNELSLSLLSGATIETMNENISNGDSRTIDRNILSDNEFISFRPLKPYNRVKISLNAGILTTNGELQIYRASQSALVTPCATLPGDAFSYYPFNGNTNELIHNKNLSPSFGTSLPTFQDNLVCGKAASAIMSEVVQLRSLDYFSFPEKTISFWAKVNRLIVLSIGDTQFFIAGDIINIKQTPFQAKSMSRPDFFNSLHHYSISVLPKYRTPAEKALCIQQPGGNEQDCSQPTGVKVATYIDGIYSDSLSFSNNTSWRLDGGNNRRVTLRLENAQIDELLVYNEALPDAILRTLPCVYNRPENCPSGNPAPPITVMKAAPAEEIFTISPNPTTGQITLDGNTLLLDAAISIRNTSGREVYQSSFRTKTFDLPATLPGGVYFLTLQTKDKKVYTRKIILTR